MTDNKDTGSMRAAQEIDRQYAVWMTEVAARAIRLDTIEAIILKHCLESKPVRPPGELGYMGSKPKEEI